MLGGPSGAGKSSILKMIYGNYRVRSPASIMVEQRRRHGRRRHARSPRTVLALRRHTIGYVSQFLRAVPRVAAIDVVAEPLVDARHGRERARDAAPPSCCASLNIPERLWALPPATFSGGEQQRVNIARGFISDLPILLLDEPTASLDAANRAVVVDLIAEKKRRGAAVVAIVHDDDVRDGDRRLASSTSPVSHRRLEPVMADSELLLSNARVVLSDRLIENGWVATANGIIVEIGEGRAPARGEDLAGDLLLPGLVELHTDHIEAHYVPRPKVYWDPVAAVVSYDGQLATCGITTVLNSLRVWREEGAEDVDGQAGILADAIERRARPICSALSISFICAARCRCRM